VCLTGSVTAASSVAVVPHEDIGVIFTSGDEDVPEAVVIDVAGGYADGNEPSDEIESGLFRYLSKCAVSFVPE
jgi:hypothetical protein